VKVTGSWAAVRAVVIETAARSDTTLDVRFGTYPLSGSRRKHGRETDPQTIRQILRRSTRFSRKTLQGRPPIHKTEVFTHYMFMNKS